MSATSPDGSGTVDSHSNPMTAENTSTLVVLAGTNMKIATAVARSR